MPIVQNILVEDAVLPTILPYLTPFGPSGQASAGFSPAPTFAPPDIPGNLLWVRSDLGITLGTGVSIWADQSGNGNHLTQVTGTQQPVWSATGGPKGLPMLVFNNATNQFMVTGAITMAQPVYVWLIVMWNTAFFNGESLCDGRAGNSLRLLASGSGGQLQIDCGTAIASAGGIASIATWYNYGFTSNANSSLTQNNVSIISGNAGTATPTGLTIAANGAGTGAWANCSFVEVALYNELPTAVQIEQLTVYRMSRYGF